jgi:hypothetical protein
MKPKITDAELARAKVYKQHISGWAYIPPQDLLLYERAYNKCFSANH